MLTFIDDQHLCSSPSAEMFLRFADLLCPEVTRSRDVPSAFFLPFLLERPIAKECNGHSQLIRWIRPEPDPSKAMESSASDVAGCDPRRGGDGNGVWSALVFDSEGGDDFSEENGFAGT
jgi:hypothetical protein